MRSVVRVNGSASNCRGECVNIPAARAILLKRITMSDVSTLDAVLEATEPEQVTEPEAPEQDERLLNTLLRKAESAFTRGNKGLLLSRVECGKFCHAGYALRLEKGDKDAGFTASLIVNAVT